MTPYYEPYWVESKSDSLEHFGVKGMKWGVRRYQNADGTLTEAGKKKLEKYKQNEARTAFLNRDRYKKIYENEKKKRTNKGLSDASKKEQRAQQYQKLYEKELRAIKDMSYKDMRADKIAAGKTFLSGTGMALAGSYALTAVAGHPMVFLNYGLPSAMQMAKTQNRVKRYDERQKK